MEYFESVFSRINDFELDILNGHCRDNVKIITKESREKLLQCFYFPKLDLLEGYLLYINHTDLVKQKIRHAKMITESTLETQVVMICQLMLPLEEKLNNLESNQSLTICILTN